MKFISFFKICLKRIIKTWEIYNDNETLKDNAQYKTSFESLSQKKRKERKPPLV